MNHSKPIMPMKGNGWDEDVWLVPGAMAVEGAADGSSGATVSSDIS